MSILSAIKNYAMDLLGINDSHLTIASKNNFSNASIIECSSKEEPIDILEIKNENKTKDNENNQKHSIASLKQLIENKCQKYNINYQALLKSKLLQSQDIDALKALDKSLDKLAEANYNCEIHKDVNKERLTLSIANVMYKAIKEVGISGMQDFYNLKNRANKKLGANYSVQDRNERRKRLKNSRNELNEQLRQELAELKHLPKEERIQAEQKLRNKYRLIRQAQFNDVMMKEDSEASADAIILLDSDDIDYGAKTLIETRASKTLQTQTADYMDYNFTRDLICDFKEFEDDISGNSLQTYSSTIISHKSESAVKQYQEAYVQDRKMYENALTKLQNGETLTPEEETLISTMKSEYYTATAQGIVDGVIYNTNLSTGKKAEVLAQIEDDAKQFSDYQTIKSSIEEKIKTNKDLQDKVVKSQEELNEQKNTTYAKEKSKVSIKNKNFVSYPNAEIKSGNRDRQDIAQNERQKSEQIITKPVQTKKYGNNKVLIENTLQKISDVNEAFSMFDKLDVIRVVLSDTKRFKEHMPVVINELKAAGKTTLIGIVASSSDSVVTTLCKELGKEKIEPLLNRELCYTAREEIENMG